MIEGLKTGHVIVDEGRNHKSESEIIQFDLVVQLVTIEQAIALITHASAVKDEERHALLLNFRGDQQRRGISQDEFTERFGAYLERPK